jgi:hypothetical protein
MLSWASEAKGLLFFCKKIGRSMDQFGPNEAPPMADFIPCTKAIFWVDILL